MGFGLGGLEINSKGKGHILSKFQKYTVEGKVALLEIREFCWPKGTP